MEVYEYFNEGQKVYCIGIKGVMVGIYSGVESAIKHTLRISFENGEYMQFYEDEVFPTKESLIEKLQRGYEPNEREIKAEYVSKYNVSDVMYAFDDRLKKISPYKIDRIDFSMGKFKYHFMGHGEIYFELENNDTKYSETKDKAIEYYVSHCYANKDCTLEAE